MTAEVNDPLASARDMKQLMRNLRASVADQAREIPFTPAENAAIDAALTARAPHNATWASILTAVKAHVIPLKRGRKKPVNSGWPLAPAMDEATTAAHLDRSGNVGALLGASGERGWIAWDLDNELATKAVTDAGYRTVTVPANSYNPNHSKGRFGGRHVIWAVPEEWGVSGVDLTAPKATVHLANGGTADVLTGSKFIVLPPSVLCDEGVTNPYNPASSVWPGPIEPLPIEYWPDRWRPAGTPEPPPELAALRVDIRPKSTYEFAESRYLSADANELTEKVDAISWSQYLELDTDNLITVLDTIDSCGCNKLHFSGQSQPDGGVLHDGCPYGKGVHVHSGSLAAHLAANGEHRDHMSRADFMAGLLGRPMRDVARDVGIELRGGREREELGGSQRRSSRRWLRPRTPRATPLLRLASGRPPQSSEQP
ncbi:bifunctional DNA primase/polymerase [Mycobacterium sp. DSM 3803]|nr:bifunctional DNA primase/polymerase [Mycobacterium sp. DSM 3803]